VFVTGVYSGPIEVFVSHFHLRLDEIAELTPLQKAWYLEIFNKQNPRR
jgi:hypothetical protein